MRDERPMTESFLGGRVVLHAGDCLAVLRTLPENSVDSVVTDPPYGLEFMGREWDHGVPGVPYWTEALRVLKPGGHIAAFGGTRTYHRMAVAIEDAGFEIRDQLGWAYGSGFPKSRNIGDGRGTALKPAWEPICLARKPLSEPTVAANVLRWGTGAINIDGCRVAGPKTPAPVGQYGGSDIGPNGHGGARNGSQDSLGRWPANLVHDGSDEVVACFPETTSGSGNKNVRNRDNGNTIGNGLGNGYGDGIGGDSGSAARFFYAAKADSGDRFGARHPTVKPVDLMRWLVRLITPPGGVCLDPFAGTGTTGEAAFLEGFSAILIEREAEHQADIRRRMAYVLGGPDERMHAIVKARGKTADAGPLFAGLEAAE